MFRFNARLDQRLGHFRAMRNYSANDLAIIANDRARPLLVRVAAVHILTACHCPADSSHLPYPAKRMVIRKTFAIPRHSQRVN